jgi:hypothetical protein
MGIDAIHDLKNCANKRLVVGIHIRYVPAMLFLCVESADEQFIVVEDRDVNGLPIPFNREIKIADVLAIKVTSTRFDDPDLVILRGWYRQREAFLNMTNVHYLSGPR